MLCWGAILEWPILTDESPISLSDSHVLAGRTAADAIPRTESALDDTVAGRTVPSAVAGRGRSFATIPAGGRATTAFPHPAITATDGGPVPSEWAAAPVPEPVHSYADA